MWLLPTSQNINSVFHNRLVRSYPICLATKSPKQPAYFASVSSYSSENQTTQSPGPTWYIKLTIKNERSAVFQVDETNMLSILRGKSCILSGGNPSPPHHTAAYHSLLATSSAYHQKIITGNHLWGPSTRRTDVRIYGAAPTARKNVRIGTIWDTSLISAPFDVQGKHITHPKAVILFGNCYTPNHTTPSVG